MEERLQSMPHSSRRWLVTNRQKNERSMIEYALEFLSSRQLTLSVC